MIAQINYVLKAVFAAATAGVWAAAAATVDGSEITQNELWVIAGAALGAFGVTYFTPNTPKSTGRS